MTFVDRRLAGIALGRALAASPPPDAVVLGLPRGGVPVAAEVARALAAPLDVIVVRKLGAPRQPELALGAIGEDGARVVDEELARRVGVRAEDLAAIERRERAVLEARLGRLRAQHPRVDLHDRCAVIVDDGLATGSTMRAAILVARAHGAAEVLVAVPVGPPEVVEDLRRVADLVVCLEEPAYFAAVGAWYEDFRPIEDAEVERLLAADPTRAR